MGKGAEWASHESKAKEVLGPGEALLWVQQATHRLSPSAEPASASCDAYYACTACLSTVPGHRGVKNRWEEQQEALWQVDIGLFELSGYLGTCPGHGPKGSRL